MTPYDPQEVEERFQRLPEPLKDAMLSVENSERIFEVGKKFALTVEQIGFLAEESGYVVLGLTHPNDFVGRLSQHLRVDGAKAKAIAQVINHQIFFPLREILKNTHQFELTQEQIQEPTLPISPISPPQALRPAPPLRPNAPPPITLRETPKPSAPVTIAPVTPSTPAPIKPFASVIPDIKAPLPPAPSAPSMPSSKPASIPSSPPPSIAIAPPARLIQTPIQRPVPPPLSPLPPAAIQEKNFKMPITPLPPAITPPKSLEGIKTKDVPPATQTPVPETPLAPSQIMQKKLLDERQRAPSPVRSEAQRMKESLFAPPSAPSAPAQTVPLPTPVPQSPPSPPAPEVSAQPSTPSSYSGSDPYREPLE